MADDQDILKTSESVDDDALAEINDALESQQNEIRSARVFDKVDDLRKYIENERPSEHENVTIDMCIHEVKEIASGFRIDLVSKKVQPSWFRFKSKMEDLDFDRSNALKFNLTVWDKKKELKDQFTPGKTHIFYNVHKLKMYYKLAQGITDGQFLVKQEQLHSQKRPQENDSTTEAKKQKEK